MVSSSDLSELLPPMVPKISRSFACKQNKFVRGSLVLLILMVLLVLLVLLPFHLFILSVAFLHRPLCSFSP